MLSKEKIEDDYIAHLRLESFQLTAIIGLVVSILSYSLSKDMKLTLDYFIFLSTWCYLIIFFIKKDCINVEPNKSRTCTTRINASTIG